MYWTWIGKKKWDMFSVENPVGWVGVPNDSKSMLWYYNIPYGFQLLGGWKTLGTFLASIFTGTKPYPWLLSSLLADKKSQASLQWSRHAVTLDQHAWCLEVACPNVGYINYIVQLCDLIKKSEPKWSSCWLTFLFEYPMKKKNTFSWSEVLPLKKKKKTTSKNPPPDPLFWHGFRHTIWKILEVYIYGISILTFWHSFWHIL
jgi:hypothetical protein